MFLLPGGCDGSIFRVARWTHASPIAGPTHMRVPYLISFAFPFLPSSRLLHWSTPLLCGRSGGAAGRPPTPATAKGYTAPASCCKRRPLCFHGDRRGSQRSPHLLPTAITAATSGDHRCYQRQPPAATNNDRPCYQVAESELQLTTIAARKGGGCSERLPAVLAPVDSQAASQRRVVQAARSGATKGEQCCCWRWSTVLCQVVDHASIGGLWCYRPEQRMMQVAAGVAAIGGATANFMMLLLAVFGVPSDTRMMCLDGGAKPACSRRSSRPVLRGRDRRCWFDNEEALMLLMCCGWCYRRWWSGGGGYWGCGPLLQRPSSSAAASTHGGAALSVGGSRTSCARTCCLLFFQLRFRWFLCGQKMLWVDNNLTTHSASIERLSTRGSEILIPEGRSAPAICNPRQKKLWSSDTQGLPNNVMVLHRDCHTVWSFYVILSTFINIRCFSFTK
jgi:hypothetical protein